MGVNSQGDMQRTRVPQNSEWGKLMQIVPFRFSQKIPLRIHQNAPFQGENSIIVYCIVCFFVFSIVLPYCAIWSYDHKVEYTLLLLIISGPSPPPQTHSQCTPLLAFNQAFWTSLCIPRVSSKFTPTVREAFTPRSHVPL